MATQLLTQIKNLKFILLALVLMAGIIALAFPKSQTLLRAMVFSNRRVILAKTQAMITPEGPELTLIKVRQDGQILLEAYQEIDSMLQLTSRWALPLHMKEGYFMFRENATNLALADIDKDNSLEVLVPAVEQNITPRLMIYKYNPATGNFNILTPAL